MGMNVTTFVLQNSAEKLRGVGGGECTGWSGASRVGAPGAGALADLVDVGDAQRQADGSEQ